ncbi:hypothetical protein [Salinispora arenicola]|uniref:hypothetical protein n=1 Tax=Salinispora arenicola TaxID=168697 RepID=UPI0003A798AD|nr:hypothetical protein [Salinispora arenicola]
MTHWKSGMQLTPARLGERESGEVAVSFTDQTSHTQVVTFAAPFAAPPHVSTQIVSGSGAAARWESRPISISATQFTLFVYRGDGSASPSTWSDVPVQWIAVL